MRQREYQAWCGACKNHWYLRLRGVTYAMTCLLLAVAFGAAVQERRYQRRLDRARLLWPMRQRLLMVQREIGSAVLPAFQRLMVAASEAAVAFQAFAAAWDKAEAVRVQHDYTANRRLAAKLMGARTWEDDDRGSL